MTLTVIGVADVHVTAVQALGLDPSYLDLEAPEALAALVRRAASFVSPCPERRLRAEIGRALRGLAGTDGGQRDEMSDTIDGIIEAVVSYGDLLELPAEEDAARLLYFSPPTFVALDGVLFLIGGQADGQEALPSDLQQEVEYRNHTRRLRTADAAEVAERLRAIGWIELPRKLWLAAPDRHSADELLTEANTALNAARASGDVPGLRVLDPQASPTYYPGRWFEPIRKSGRYVARRERRFGADLWSFVELSNGIVTGLVDLPLDRRTTSLRGCDAAWHLQMAIDKISGRPQHYRRRPKPPVGSVIVDLFSPVPLWARRTWDVLGDEVPRDRSLFAYRFPEAEFAEVERSLHDDLWLSESSRT